MLILAIPASCSKDKTIKPTEFLDIPLQEITKTISYYPVIIDDISIEVLAVRTSDGSIRTAFNTCERCYTSGKGYYIQEGSDVICQQCKMRFNIDSMGIEPGGCQPIPITDENRTVTDDLIRISYDVLAANMHWFAGLLKE